MLRHNTAGYRHNNKVKNQNIKYYNITRFNCNGAARSIRFPLQEQEQVVYIERDKRFPRYKHRFSYHVFEKASENQYYKV